MMAFVPSTNKDVIVGNGYFFVGVDLVDNVSSAGVNLGDKGLFASFLRCANGFGEYVSMW